MNSREIVERVAPLAYRDRHVEPARRVGRPIGGAGPAPDGFGELVVVEGHPLHLAGRGAHHAEQHLEAQAIAGLEGEIGGQAGHHEVVGAAQAGVVVAPDRLVARAARAIGVGQVELGGVAQLGLGRLVEGDDQAGQIGEGHLFELKGVEPADHLDQGRRCAVAADVRERAAEGLSLEKRMRLLDHRACCHKHSRLSNCCKISLSLRC